MRMKSFVRTALDTAARPALICAFSALASFVGQERALAQAGLQFTGILEGDVRHEVDAQVIVEAAAHFNP